MANITTYLSKILNNKSVIENAQYGKDVRAALANVAQAVYNALSVLSVADTENLSDGCVTKDKLSSDLNSYLTSLLINTSESTGVKSISAMCQEKGITLMICDDGEIAFGSVADFLSQKETKLQCKVCKKIDDLNGMTPDLNTIESGCNCIDIIADMSDEGKSGYCQPSNCPEVQEYDSYGFHFSRLYNVEYFRSNYDNILWMRKNKGAWIQLTSTPNA